MTELLFPRWMNPFVRESNGQLIHRSLWQTDWLTNPADAEVGMSVYHADGSLGRIKYVSFSKNCGVEITYATHDGFKTATAREIENDPTMVIV